MKSVRLTIVIPYYTVNDIILECMYCNVLSLQRYSNDIKFILVSDCSEYEDQVKQRLSKFDNVVFERLDKNSGTSEARNYGFSKVDNSDYTLFWDADDLITSPDDLFNEISCTEYDMIVLPLISQGFKRTMPVSTESLMLYGNVNLFRSCIRTNLILNNNLKYYKNLYLHEDNVFDEICWGLAETKKICNTYFGVYNYAYNDLSGRRVQKERFDYLDDCLKIMSLLLSVDTICKITSKDNKEYLNDIITRIIPKYCNDNSQENIERLIIIIYACEETVDLDNVYKKIYELNNDKMNFTLKYFLEILKHGEQKWIQEWKSTLN